MELEEELTPPHPLNTRTVNKNKAARQNKGFINMAQGKGV